MALACVVPGCRSNHRFKNGCIKKCTTVFRFPKNEELRKAWLKAIRRENYMITPNSSVCILHFSSDCLSSSSNRLRLLPNSIPSVFSNIAENTGKKQNLKENLIVNFTNLRSRIEKRINLNHWFLHKNKNFIVLCLLKNDKNYGCEFKFRIKISRELRVRCFSDEIEVPAEMFKNILPKNSNCGMKLEFWYQLGQLLCFVNNMESFTIQNDSSNYLTQALQFLYKYKTSMENKNIKSLDIAIDQIRMLTTKRFKYSTNSIKMSFSIFQYSKPSYLILSNFLAVPSNRYLELLIAKTRRIENEKNQSNVGNHSMRIPESRKESESDISDDDINTDANFECGSTIEWVDVDMNQSV